MTIHQILEPNIVPEFVIRHRSCLYFTPVCKELRNQVLVGRLLVNFLRITLGWNLWLPCPRGRRRELIRTLTHTVYWHVSYQQGVRDI